MADKKYAYAEYCKAYRAKCKKEHICQRCGKQDERTLAGRSICAECNVKVKAMARAIDKAKKKEANARYRAKKKASDKQWFTDHNLPYTAPSEIAKCLNCTKPECDDCIGKARRKEEYQSYFKKEDK